MNDKDRLRGQLKLKRSEFGGEERQTADIAVLNNFLSEFGGYGSYLIYNSLPSEADTGRIISVLLNAGKRVYLPRVEGGNLVAAEYGKTIKGAFGIEEPQGREYCGEIDVTVIPLLAVNPRGFRIGYGKGFYDGYLRHRRTKKVGLGYSFQSVEFDEDEWDIPLDFFVCEKGIYCNENNFGKIQGNGSVRIQGNGYPPDRGQG